MLKLISEELVKCQVLVGHGHRRKMVAAVELELEYYIRAEKETADIERFENDDKKKKKKKCWATLKTLTKSENTD